MFCCVAFAEYFCNNARVRIDKILELFRENNNKQIVKITEGTLGDQVDGLPGGIT